METFDSMEDARPAIQSLAEADTRETAEDTLGFTRLCYKEEDTAFYIERINDDTLQVELSTKKTTSDDLPPEIQETENEVWMSLEGTNFESSTHLDFWRTFDGGAEFKQRVTV